MSGKRDAHRRPIDLAFVRKADGSLRPANEGRDIKDIWADVNRIKLKDAIESDQKKRVRRERRRNLFGVIKASRKHEDATNDGKTVEIKIDVSGLSFDLFKRRINRLGRWLRRTTRKQRGIVVGVLAFAVLFIGSFGLYGEGSRADRSVLPKVTSESTRAQSMPDYPTVLPIDKTIEKLGGWTRVSPPDKEPVYAFKDQIDGVAITVSEQPLPEDFKKDKEAEISKLAEQFAAKEKITAGDTQAYLGTSAQGPQSVILSKNDLLILVKSATKLTSQQWENYLATLQ